MLIFIHNYLRKAAALECMMKNKDPNGNNMGPLNLVCVLIFFSFPSAVAPFLIGYRHIQYIQHCHPTHSSHIVLVILHDLFNPPPHLSSLLGFFFSRFSHTHLLLAHNCS